MKMKMFRVCIWNMVWSAQCLLAYITCMYVCFHTWWLSFQDNSLCDDNACNFNWQTL